MKKLYLLIALVGLGILCSFTVKDCSYLKNNSFKYKVGSKDVLIIFGDEEYIEYHENKRYYIKSDIEWLTDCEYNLIIQESTLPSFPFKSGTTMNIKVDRIKGKKVYYTATLGGRSWEWKMTKVSK
ncbi:hypothetical protein CW731_10200 [Polaribacter sp. ALD11]|uniref:hypothetical protein n=1 Tax=Polaribacter sp. ALD11 TaxID=2058137 RepID=UPI000C3193A3|nr:hypothetical protein [Polaribacter sp. ALD11]AUC85635.1 hypothetical protein CW731_10200 [Polaribacter sp. ALD11]